jgi:hypothetical protein
VPQRTTDDDSAARVEVTDAGHRVAHTTVHVQRVVGIDLDVEAHRYFTAAKRWEFAYGGTPDSAGRRPCAGCRTRLTYPEELRVTRALRPPGRGLRAREIAFPGGLPRRTVKVVERTASGARAAVPGWNRQDT